MKEHTKYGVDIERMLNFSPVQLSKPELLCFHLLPKFQPAKLFSPVLFKCWEVFDDTDMVYYDAAFCVFQQRFYFSQGENVKTLGFLSHLAFYLFTFFESSVILRNLIASCLFC